jgi:transposase
MTLRCGGSATFDCTFAQLYRHAPAGKLPCRHPHALRRRNQPGGEREIGHEERALDLGAKKIAYCEVSGGEVIDRATVSSFRSLESMLGPTANPARVAIEACREAWFVYATLTEWGNEVLLIDTTRSREMGIGRHRRKNDRIDAEVMARAVEKGGIPLAHLLSPHRQELRRQLSVRRALVETRAQYVTTMRGLARELGCALPSCDTEHFVAKMRKTMLSQQVRTRSSRC